MKAGIAGAGIMGQMMAFMLVNAGWDVTIFDQSLEGNCSMAAAGLLAPVTELENSDNMIHELGMQALKQHWPDIIRKLQQDIYFNSSGSLLLAHARDCEEMHRFIAVLTAKLSNTDDIKRLNQDEITSIETELTRFAAGYYFQHEGQIDAQQIMQVMTSYLLEMGVRWQQNTFVLQASAGLIASVERQYYFDLVVDCRGLGAKQAFKHLRGLRGELIWLHAPAVTITRPVRFLHPRYRLYIVPRPDHHYLIGASEIEAEDYSAISVQTTLELLTAAYCVHPGFSEARMIRTVTQCRPTLVHHRPEIKVSPGYIAINGLYRHGFLLAPALASEVMHWLLNGACSQQYPQLWEQAA